MRSTLILITLATVLVSCGKKENNLGSSVAKEAFEQKEFLTISHEENASLIRSKLLNFIVEQDFPPSFNKPENTILKNDELDNFEISDRDLKNYQEKEKGFSKVIVSYVDREEVYFIPERVSVMNLASELQLSPGIDRVFKLLPSENDKTFKGGVFYLVSLNHADLMKNDQKFFSAQSKNILNQSLLVNSFTKVLLSVDYDFYLPKIVTQSFSMPTPRCPAGDREGGQCFISCKYKRNMPTSDFEKSSETSLENLGFSLKYSQNFIHTNSDEVVNERDGHFEVKIESNEFLEDNFTIEVAQRTSATYQRNTDGYEYSSSCKNYGGNIYGQATLQSRVDFLVTMTVFGRGTELKKIRL
jgi:hypothetical protein